MGEDGVIQILFNLAPRLAGAMAWRREKVGRLEANPAVLLASNTDLVTHRLPDEAPRCQF